MITFNKWLENREIYGLTINNDGDHEYRNDRGELHRVNGPATLSRNGDKAYYLNGQLHNVNGPSIASGPKSKHQYHFQGRKFPTLPALRNHARDYYTQKGNEALKGRYRFTPENLHILADALEDYGNDPDLLKDIRDFLRQEK